MRPICKIAKDIRETWKNPSPHAMPYLRAMDQLYGMKDKYGQDDARGIVLYFLTNATHWRGADARRIKAELNAMLAVVVVDNNP